MIEVEMVNFSGHENTDLSIFNFNTSGLEENKLNRIFVNNSVVNFYEVDTSSWYSDLNLH